LNLQKTSLVAEIVGGVAVVVTLVYLTIQVQQNTDATRSATWQSTQDAETRFDAMLTQDPVLLDLFTRGMVDGIDALDTELEQARFLLAGKQLLDLFHTHHYQHELGIISDELWATWVSQFEDSIHMQGMRDIVKSRYPYFRPSFADFIDEYVEIESE